MRYAQINHVGTSLHSPTVRFIELPRVSGACHRTLPLIDWWIMKGSPTYIILHL